MGSLPCHNFTPRSESRFIDLSLETMIVSAPPSFLDCCDAHSASEMGPVLRVTPVQTAMRQ
jgi:hypothetical protein